MPNPLKERNDVTYVLDFVSNLRYQGEDGQPVDNFIIHQLETGERAVNFARLIRRVFISRDNGQAPTINNPRAGRNAPQNYEAFKAYDNIDAIKAACPGIKVIPYNGIIPSLNKAIAALQEDGVRPEQGHQFNLELYNKVINFLTRVIPPDLIQIQNPDGPQAA